MKLVFTVFKRKGPILGSDTKWKIEVEKNIGNKMLF